MRVKLKSKRTFYIETEIEVSDYSDNNSIESQIEWFAKMKNGSNDDSVFEIIFDDCGFNNYEQIESEIESEVILVKA